MHIKANYTSAIWQHVLHIPPTKILTAKQNKQANKSHTQEPTRQPFGKWRFREKDVKRMGTKQKRIRRKERQD